MAATARGPGPPGRPVDLAIVGHVNLDHLLEVDRLPSPDRTVPAHQRRTLLGGPAANLALAAAAYGVRTALISRVGTDFPDGFQRQLEAAGVDLRGLERVRGESSSACIIVHSARGEQMTIIDQGPMADAKHAVIPERVLAESSWVHLATGDPRYLRRVQRRALELGARVGVDPAQEVHYRWTSAELRPYFADAEILFGNEHEIAAAARLVADGDVRGLTDIVPLVVMTRGSHGARAYFRGGTIDVPSRRIPRPRDPTGAGDAFRGGFYTAWFVGESLRYCLRAGTRAAARWLTDRNRAPTRPARRRP